MPDFESKFDGSLLWDDSWGIFNELSVLLNWLDRGSCSIWESANEFLLAEVFASNGGESKDRVSGAS